MLLLLLLFGCACACCSNECGGRQQASAAMECPRRGAFWRKKTTMARPKKIPPASWRTSLRVAVWFASNATLFSDDITYHLTMMEVAMLVDNCCCSCCCPSSCEQCFLCV